MPARFTGTSTTSCTDIDECATNNGGCVRGRRAAIRPVMVCSPVPDWLPGSGATVTTTSTNARRTMALSTSRQSPARTRGLRVCGQCPARHGRCHLRRRQRVPDEQRRLRSADAASARSALSCSPADRLHGQRHDRLRDITNVSKTTTAARQARPSPAIAFPVRAFVVRVRQGAHRDGITCTDIDECRPAAAVARRAVCLTNTPGSRTWSVPAGYIGNSLTCTDVNECQVNNGGCSANAAARTLRARGRARVTPATRRWHHLRAHRRVRDARRQQLQSRRLVHEYGPRTFACAPGLRGTASPAPTSTSTRRTTAVARRVRRCLHQHARLAGLCTGPRNSRQRRDLYRHPECRGRQGCGAYRLRQHSSSRTCACGPGYVGDGFTRQHSCPPKRTFGRGGRGLPVGACELGNGGKSDKHRICRSGIGDRHGRRNDDRDDDRDDDREHCPSLMRVSIELPVGTTRAIDLASVESASRRCAWRAARGYRP